jgi:hypothetical protein
MTHEYIAGMQALLRCSVADEYGMISYLLGAFPCPRADVLVTTLGDLKIASLGVCDETLLCCMYLSRVMPFPRLWMEWVYRSNHKQGKAFNMNGVFLKKIKKLQPTIGPEGPRAQLTMLSR